MKEKTNILFLDFDGVLNSIRSFYKKFAEHHGVEWTEDDFDLKWYGKGNREHFAPGFVDKVDKVWDEEKAKDGYVFPDLSMYNWPHEEDAIIALNKIVEENKCKIVVCSTWRLSRSVKKLQKILTGWGAVCEVIDITTNLRSDHVRRGREILNWVMDHRKEIKGICILDDEASYDINPVFEKWAVQGISTHKHGLRDAHVSMAKSCFETPIDPWYDFDDWVSEDLLKKARKDDDRLDR